MSGSVDIIGILACINAAAVPNCVACQVICPGAITRRVKVHTVGGLVLILLATVGEVVQRFTDIYKVAALAQRHIGQHIIDGGNAGIVQTRLGIDDIFLHGRNGLNIIDNARIQVFTQDVDQSFIAAILTIIGYSINDKVVIFDRIREYQTLYPKRNIKDNINNAINSTLTRTINTSGTTLVVLLAIFLFGGEVIRGFVFALLFGVLISIYSTVFTATPIAYDLIRRKEKEETK